MYRIFYLIFTLFAFTVSISAVPLVTLNSENTNIDNFELEYFVDKNQSMLFDEVKEKNFHKINSQSSLGKKAIITWLRFNIVNDTKEDKKLLLHNKISYLSKEMEFIEIDDNGTCQKYKVTLSKEINMEIMHGTDAIFPFSLKAHSKKTIYIKNKMLDYQYFNIALYDEKASDERMKKKQTYYLLILGMLIALIVYHSILYVVTTYKEYLYYILYLSSAFLWEIQLSGILASEYNFYYTPNTEYILLIVLFVPIFLVLFTQKIFNTKDKYLKEERILNSIIWLFILNIIIGVFNISWALNIASYTYMYLFIALILSTYFIYRKGNPLALIFLIGNGFFLLFTLINLLFFLGAIPYNWFTYNSALIGIIIESLVLALVILYRIRLLQKSEIEKIKIIVQKEELKKANEILQSKIDIAVKEIKRKEKQLQQQSRLAQMGEAINMIAHQWSQPLGAVSAVVMGIHSKIALNKFNLASSKGQKECTDYLDNKLYIIDEYVSAMSETINDFKNFFKKQDKTECLSVNLVVEKALSMISISLNKHNIKVTCKLKSQKEIALFNNEVIQVILNILQNSSEAFIDNKIKERIVLIYTYDISDEVIIAIHDNAGGIPENIIENIFDPYYSTKMDKNGTGIGLYMSKIIMEEHHTGELSVKNKNNGVTFMLKFPLLKELLS